MQQWVDTRVHNGKSQAMPPRILLFMLFIAHSLYPIIISLCHHLQKFAEKLSSLPKSSFWSWWSSSSRPWSSSSLPSATYWDPSSSQKRVGCIIIIVIIVIIIVIIIIIILIIIIIVMIKTSCDPSSSFEMRRGLAGSRGGDTSVLDHNEDDWEDQDQDQNEDWDQNSE